MAQNSNEAIRQLTNLYEDIRKIEKTIDRISYHPECPPVIRYEVLKPFKAKLSWFRNALEAKLGDQINVKGYKQSYNENLINGKIARMLSYMTPDQQLFTANLISGILEGKVIKVAISEEADEEVF